MFVLSKRNLIIPAPDGTESVRLARGEMVEIPNWAEKGRYFQALVKDGKIVPTATSDKATQAAYEKKVRTRRGQETTEE